MQSVGLRVWVAMMLMSWHIGGARKHREGGVAPQDGRAGEACPRQRAGGLGGPAGSRSWTRSRVCIHIDRATHVHDTMMVTLPRFTLMYMLGPPDIAPPKSTPRSDRNVKLRAVLCCRGRGPAVGHRAPSQYASISCGLSYVGYSVRMPSHAPLSGSCL